MTGDAGEQRTFEELLAEGDAVPVAGWDFSWFDGRATEERPSWGYAALLADRICRAESVLDIQTGGGEVLAGAVRCSGADAGQRRQLRTLAATESWPPNVELARRSLEPLGGLVAPVADDDRLPLAAGSFDLVTSRHPTIVVWPEIARVLRPGGGYLAQHIGPEFFDVAAVVHFLKKVLWTVPGFTVAGFAAPLARMHEHIQEHGSFVCHAQRFLIEARKPS